MHHERIIYFIRYRYPNLILNMKQMTSDFLTFPNYVIGTLCMHKIIPTQGHKIREHIGLREVRIHLCRISLQKMHVCKFILFYGNDFQINLPLAKQIKSFPIFLIVKGP